MIPTPLVSVVIVTYNREHEITRCIESLQKSSFSDFEIIAVDNASTDNTVSIIERDFSSTVRLIKSRENLMAAGGRNLGTLQARGQLVLFVDSDNVVHPEMIAQLTAWMTQNPQCGVCGPFMYYFESPERVWCGGVSFDWITSRTTYQFANQNYPKPPSELPWQTHHVPNIFMVRKSDFERLRGFNEDYQIMYEECDLAERLRQEGRVNFIVPQAQAWHDVPVLTDGSLRAYGLQSEMRARLLARNRIIFMKLHSQLWQYLIFSFFFLPLFTTFYLYRILKLGAFKIAQAYLRGVWEGLFYKSSYPTKVSPS